MAKASLKDELDFAAHAGLRLLPSGLCSAVGALGARVRGPKAYPVEDRRAAANMRRLRPDWDEAMIAAAGLRRWDNIGRLMAEYSVLHRLVPEGRVTTLGQDHFAAARAMGKGVVLLGLHLGNWEVATLCLGAMGLTPGTFYTPQAGARDVISNRVRRRIGAALFTPDLDGVKSAMKHLKRGGALALFADESVRGVVRGPFFGRPPHLDGNLRHAVQLSRATGAPIMPGFVLRAEGCRFVGHCLEPIVLPPEEKPGARLSEDVMLLNAVMEPLALAHLDQWYFLHDRLE